MRKLLLARLAPLLALGACSPGGSGPLQPIAGPGVTLASTHGLPDDTARLTSGGVQADVTGRWSRENESVEIVYAASAPARITISSRSTWRGTAANASDAWDVTEKTPGNAIGVPLLDGKGLQLGSGDRRTVQIMFARPDRGERPRVGDQVTISVPMPGGPESVRFRLAGE